MNIYRGSARYHISKGFYDNVLENFLDNNIFCIGFDSENTKAYTILDRMVKNDIIYIKENTLHNKFIIRAIGIVTSNDIETFKNIVSTNGNKYPTCYGKKVKWIRNYFTNYDDLPDKFKKDLEFDNNSLPRNYFTTLELEKSPYFKKLINKLLESEIGKIN